MSGEFAILNRGVCDETERQPIERLLLAKIVAKANKFWRTGTKTHSHVGLFVEFL